MRAGFLSIVLIGLSFSLGTVARADVPPPNACGGEGSTCKTAGPSYDSEGVCQKQRCSRSLPGPNGVETHEYDCLLCIEAPKKPATPPTKKAGCAVGSGDEGGVLAFLLVGSAFLFANRRRRS